MLFDFLIKYEVEILAMTEKKSSETSGSRATSVQSKKGLPIFYKQLLAAMQVEDAKSEQKFDSTKQSLSNIVPILKKVPVKVHSKLVNEDGVSKSAGFHGMELLRLGYTLSQVVHAYGAMCQSITELATTKNVTITSVEFHKLNRCLDVAIAGAVTEYQALRNIQETSREVQHLGFLAHELRNALGTITLSIDLIKDGTVGFNGQTGAVLDNGLLRMQELIDRSLTEVRLRVDPKIYTQPVDLLVLMNQILVTAEIEAVSKNQTLKIQIDPTLQIEGDQHLIYSAMSNIIQNALKYTPVGGKIEVRANSIADNIIVEVEDECGGLSAKAIELFKPFKRMSNDRIGLGLGLTIAQRAISLSQGTIEVRNIVGVGCVFCVTLPKQHNAVANL